MPLRPTRRGADIPVDGPSVMDKKLGGFEACRQAKPVARRVKAGQALPAYDGPAQTGVCAGLHPVRGPDYAKLIFAERGFFRDFKATVVSAYYMSEPGATEERRADGHSRET